VTEEREHPIENLAAYALGALESSKRMRVDDHVAACATCASSLEQYRAVAGTLPLELDPVPPPAGAWAAIRAEAVRRRPRGTQPAGTTGRSGWRRVTWPVLTALAASLLVWNVVLQLELRHRPPGPEVEALARRPGRLVILAGTGAPGASGRLLVAIDGHHGHLATAGLTP
jgi:anti-sigma-K factor RskA